jgi:hypothetical protein
MMPERLVCKEGRVCMQWVFRGGQLILLGCEIWSAVVGADPDVSTQTLNLLVCRHIRWLNLRGCCQGGALSCVIACEGCSTWALNVALYSAAHAAWWAPIPALHGPAAYVSNLVVYSLHRVCCRVFVYLTPGVEGPPLWGCNARWL